MRGPLVTVAAAAVLALATPAVSHGAIPDSLKQSCTTESPHPGYSYIFCDDGLPPTGGTTPNEGGIAAVTVPAKYEGGWEGLPLKAPDAADEPGADSQGDVALDVDVSMPATPAPVGGYPLMVMVHGCCGGTKRQLERPTFDENRLHWHYSNAWFASRGYVVVNYTGRGFGLATANGDSGSTGEDHLASRDYEMNDMQSIAAQLADDPFFGIDPQRVVVTGGSYGGAAAWLALTDPVWRSPAGLAMRVVAVGVTAGWTDMTYALAPTGKQTLGQIPALDTSDSTNPFGIPKFSIAQLLYSNSTFQVGTGHANFAPEIDALFSCLLANDPYETNPECQNTLGALFAFTVDTSAYYQHAFFDRVATDPSYRVPVFAAQGLSDPLFPAIEARRMGNRLQQVSPGYPIQEYYGDIAHFNQNKAKEWGDICGADHHVCTFNDYPGGDVNAPPAELVRTGVNTRLSRFLDHYARPAGNPAEPEPAFDVTASLQVCPQNAGSQAPDEPGETFTAPSYRGLTGGGTLQLDVHSTQTTVNDVVSNPHADNADPITNAASNDGSCPVETQPAGAGVATFDSDPLASDYTMIGGTTVTVNYSATTTAGMQLDARLYDVFPDGTAVMVDRGERRVEVPSGALFFQLHGNAWRFAAGHRVRIELAQDDDPYLRASTVSSSATLTHVTLRLPVREPAPYARPRGATPIIVSLVPAFDPCGASNLLHGSPLASPSCGPPSRSAQDLTFGTPDVNGAAPASTGFVRLYVCPLPGCPAGDVLLDAHLTDVRRPSLADYDGQLEARIPLRVTDRASGPLANEPATGVDVELRYPLSCVPTPEATGASCSGSTTANAVVPGAAVSGKRAIWEVGQVEVLDGGAGVGASGGNQKVLVRQGLFVP